MTSILRHVAEAFPPARQGTILNSHGVIGIATNTSIVLRDGKQFNVIPRTKLSLFRYRFDEWQ